MKNHKLDPRTKFAMVLLLSTLALIYNNIYMLSSILGVSLIIAFLISSDEIHILIRLRRLLGVMVAIAIVQGVFTTGGNPVISIGKFPLITDYGIIKSLEFILRLGIIIISSVIITTSSSREIVQGLIQMRIPYEIAFMVSVATRFLPMLREEMTDMIIAIQLRGIDLKRVKIKDKMKLYKYIFIPVVTNSILKARELSTSMEMKGFRAYPVRTSYMVLKMKSVDYIIIFLSIIIAMALIILNIKI